MDFRDSPQAVKELDEAGHLVTSRWVRANEYEIRNGCVAPVFGAKFEVFDPWERYQEIRGAERSRANEGGQGRGHKSEMEPGPYQELPGLVPASTRVDEVTPAELERITSWCSRNGLLGLLACRSSEATLFPSWQWWHEEVDELEQAEYVLLPAQTRHVRSARTWQTLRTYDLYTDRPEPDEEDEGQPVTIEPEDRWFPRNARWRSLGRDDWRPESLEKSWARFFPDLPAGTAEEYQYPRPESADFWALYGEPIEDFLRALRLFKKMMERLGSVRPSVRREGVDTLDSLVSVLSPGGQLTKAGELKQRWFSPALLATFAMMLLQDQTGPARVKLCPACGTPNVFEYRVYCNLNCQRKGRQQRHRDKVKKAKQLYRGGSAEAEIAMALDTELETVRGWLLPDVRKKIRQLHGDGKRYQEIARIVGREPEWVRDQLLQASTKSPKPTPQR